MCKKNIIVIIIFGIIFSLLCSGTIIQTVRYRQCRAELGQCVAELRLIRESNREYEEYFEQARDRDSVIEQYNTELGKCLQEQVYTISGLREQLQQIYKVFIDMEVYLSNRDASSGSD